MFWNSKFDMWHSTVPIIREYSAEFGYHYTQQSSKQDLTSSSLLKSVLIEIELHYLPPPRGNKATVDFSSVTRDISGQIQTSVPQGLL